MRSAGCTWAAHDHGAEVDVANIFSTNSAIETEDLVVLEEPKNLLADNGLT